jgi:hypothetical protein
MKKIQTFLIAILVLITVQNINAQINAGNVQIDKTYKVELSDGTVFIGKILSKDGEIIVLKTPIIQRIEVTSSNVKSIAEIDETLLKDGDYWFTNPHASRYLFGPTAFNLKKGEGYYQNTMLALNSFNVGVTDNISIGGGLELISTVSSISSGEFQPILFVTPKVSFEVTEDFHAGAGMYYVNTPNIDIGTRSGSGLAIAYGIGTYGSKDHNLTGGLGWGFVQGQFEQKPIITVSGMTRISQKTALVTENWFISNDNYYSVFSYGIRFFGDNLAVDLAFVNNADIAEVFIIGLPWVSFVVKF